MQLILTTDVPHLGAAGEIVNVKPGYGANYLLPKGMALLATGRNKRRVEHQQAMIEAKLQRERTVAEEVGTSLEGFDVTLTRVEGEAGKIFGSVTARNIAEALEKEGYRLESRQIILEAPLKTLGVFEVPVRLHRDVTAQIRVWVVAD